MEDEIERFDVLIRQAEQMMAEAQGVFEFAKQKKQEFEQKRLEIQTRPGPTEPGETFCVEGALSVS